jgi:hypothetical protein
MGFTVPIFTMCCFTHVPLVRWGYDVVVDGITGITQQSFVYSLGLRPAVSKWDDFPKRTPCITMHLL